MLDHIYDLGPGLGLGLGPGLGLGLGPGLGPGLELGNTGLSGNRGDKGRILPAMHVPLSPIVRGPQSIPGWQHTGSDWGQLPALAPHPWKFKLARAVTWFVLCTTTILNG